MKEVIGFSDRSERNVVKPGLGAKEFPAWFVVAHTSADPAKPSPSRIADGARVHAIARTPLSSLDTRARTLTNGDSRPDLIFRAVVCGHLLSAQNRA